MRDPYQINDPYRQNDPYFQKDPYINRDPYANNNHYSNKNDPYLRFNNQSYQNQNIHKKLKFKDILFFTVLSLILLIVYLFYF